MNEEAIENNKQAQALKEKLPAVTMNERIRRMAQGTRGTTVEIPRDAFKTNKETNQ